MGAFKARIWLTCMVQSSSFLAAYALTDGCLSQLRGRDDLWNPIAGGLASGAMLWAWYKKPANTVSAGLYLDSQWHGFVLWLFLMDVPGYVWILIVRGMEY